MDRLRRDFFIRDGLEVAPELIGCHLYRKYPDGRLEQYVLTELEVYRGIDDKACHASHGLTSRTEVMYREGGLIYMYLIYGMYWMLNFVTSVEGDPHAILIRGLREVIGPGRLTRRLELDGSFYGEDLEQSERIWIVKSNTPPRFYTTTRINIDSVSEPWLSMPWRFVSDESPGT